MNFGEIKTQKILAQDNLWRHMRSGSFYKSSESKVTREVWCQVGEGTTQQIQSQIHDYITGIIKDMVYNSL